MLARLGAQEQLDDIRGRGIAFGGYEPSDAAAMLRELQNKAAGVEQRPRKASPASLAAMGIGIVSVPPQTGVNDV
jgi:hypothetical protein